MVSNTIPKNSKPPKGYSIWLHGGGSDNLAFNETLKQLQQTCHSPEFIPHVTLLGQVENIPVKTLKAALGTLAAKYHRFDLLFNKVEVQDDYFRVCCLKVQKNAFLSHLREEMTAILKFKPDKAYKAHLSLVYGKNMKDLQTARLQGAELVKEKFLVSQISLIKTAGEVNRWTKECSCVFQ